LLALQPCIPEAFLKALRGSGGDRREEMPFGLVEIFFFSCFEPTAKTSLGMEEVREPHSKITCWRSRGEV